jgi:next to BRCA1 gene 1 protein
MTFVVKATFKEETRRILFDGTKFPGYTQIQTRVSHHTAILLIPFIMYSLINLCKSLATAYLAAQGHLLTRQLRTAFNFPSSTHTYWANVLIFPDDAQEARIMFKKHVCDIDE